MLHARKILAAGEWTGDAVDVVVLDYDDRNRRRIALTGTRGLTFLLDLPRAVHLRSGDGLLLDDGAIVEVLGAPEPLAELRVADAHALTRLAWHLGNRHLPTQIVGTRLRIRRDHVIEDMARGLGAKVLAIEAPFDPEGGAYAHRAADHAHPHPH